MFTRIKIDCVGQGFTHHHQAKACTPQESAVLWDGFNFFEAAPCCTITERKWKVIGVGVVAFTS